GHLQPHRAVIDSDGAVRALRHRLGGEVQRVAVPALVLQRQRPGELGLGAAEPLLDAAQRLVLAETMRNDDDERLGHRTGLSRRAYQRPPPRTRRTTSSSSTAPMVASMIWRTMPTPRPMCSCGSSQLAISAPTTPIAMSPIRPKPAPRTILPASQPAISPTSRMMTMLSLVKCMPLLPLK